jgi:hypothetical protein
MQIPKLLPKYTMTTLFKFQDFSHLHHKLHLEYSNGGLMTGGAPRIQTVDRKNFRKHLSLLQVQCA